MAADPMLLDDDDDDDYASDQDSDFAPDEDEDAHGGGGGDEDADNTGDDSDEDDANGRDAASLQNTAAAVAAAAAAAAAGTDLAATSATGKRGSADDDDDDEGFENSGDEAVIQKGQKKLSRKQSKKAKSTAHRDGAADEDDDEEEGGGEGGLVKTRAMRAAEKAQRRDRGVVPSGPVTIDVDDMWAKMMSGAEVGSGTTGQGDLEAGGGEQGKDGSGDKENRGSGGDDVETGTSGDKEEKKNADAPAMIKIKRTYNFAGKVHTEEKHVARDSAEAKLYIASLDPKSAEYLALTSSTTAADDEEDDSSGDSQLRKPRKAFRSIFEPVLLDSSGQQQQRQRRSDLNLGLSAALQQREAAFRQGSKAKKLNVVEKSRMDWAGFVDKEGIKDELELAGRSKESYANRQDFLSRVEMNREDEARRARLAGRT